MLSFSKKKKPFVTIIVIEIAVILLALCSFNSVGTTSKAYTLQNQNSSDTFSAYSNIVCITTNASNGGGGGCTDECCTTICIKPNPIDYFTSTPTTSQSIGSNSVGSIGSVDSINSEHISALAIHKATGELYFILDSDFSVRKIDKSGKVSFVFQLSQDSNINNGSKLKSFSYMAISHNKDIYLATSDNRIIKVDSFGKVDRSFAGSGSLLASIGKSAKDCQLGKIVALDTDNLGNLYVAITSTTLDDGNYYKLSPNGQILDSYQEKHHNIKLGKLTGLAIDPVNNDVYVSDSTNNMVRKISTKGFISNVLGGGEETQKKTGILAKDIKLVNAPNAVSVGSNGTIYATINRNPGAIYQVNNGVVKLIAGSGLHYQTKDNPSSQIPLGKLKAMVSDVNGNVYTIDQSSNKLLKFITLEGQSAEKQSIENKVVESQKPYNQNQAQNQIEPQQDSSVYLRGRDVNGNQPINVSVPSPTSPTNLQVSVSGCCTINLTWTNNAQGHLGFVVERASSNTSPFTVIAEIPPNVTQYSEVGSPQTMYCYRVRLKGTISSVSFERPIGVNSPIEDNHNPTDGKIIGKRIFPDKDSPSGQPNNKVLVIAKTTFPKGTMINFKSFDIDDPSTDDPLIDPNGKLGGDNRGTMANGGIPQEGILGKIAAPVTACPDGSTGNCAEVEFTTTMFAGDNFKVVASVDDDYLSTLVLGGDGLNITESNAVPLDNTKANTSPELTVWRRLHIELDFMGKVIGNQQAAKIQNITRTPKGAVVVVDKLLAVNQYEKGNLIIDKRQFSIISNSGKMGNELQVSGFFPSDIKVGQTVQIVDDDDFNSNDRTPRGDEGETITAIAGLLDLMKESDSPMDNVYANAFIIPIFDGGGSLGNNSPNVKFQLNVEDTDEEVAKQINQGIETSVLEFNIKNQLVGVDSSGTDDYWICYVQIAYQEDMAMDKDPDKERAVEGITLTFDVSDAPIIKLGDLVPLGGFGTLVFAEVDKENKDFSEVEGISTIIPHEIGHQFGLQGDTNTTDIMGNDASTRKFLNNHLTILRARMHTPGQAK